MEASVRQECKRIVATKPDWLQVVEAMKGSRGVRWDRRGTAPRDSQSRRLGPGVRLGFPVRAQGAPRRASGKRAGRFAPPADEPARREPLRPHVLPCVASPTRPRRPSPVPPGAGAGGHGQERRLRPTFCRVFPAASRAAIVIRATGADLGFEAARNCAEVSGWGARSQPDRVSSCGQKGQMRQKTELLRRDQYAIPLCQGSCRPSP